jgi:lipopolysaccharide transport system ATP-binding protein
MSEIAIEVEGLSKCYRIGASRNKSDTLSKKLRNFVTSPIDYLQSTLRSPTEEETLWALKDLSFEVERGKVVGIIGRNGSGKSTLLKILSRITEPTTGRAYVYGRVASLLEVGTGFHPDLTGRENIYLSGSILGMRKREIDDRFDEIVTFSEIEKFLDTPVKRYSSGMYVRLAFAVAAHLESEILIIDEVLAVGDAAFQKKCLGKMRGASNTGRTVLFVSHNMPMVKSLCEKAILLEDGRINTIGNTNQVIDKYISKLDKQLTSITIPEDPRSRIQILHAELLGYNDNQSDKISFLCRYVVHKELNDVLLCVEVRNSSDVSVFYSNDGTLNDDRKRKVGMHTVELEIPIYLFCPGNYNIAFGFWEPGRDPEHFPDERLTFTRDEPITRLSNHGIPWPSIIYMPSTWNYIPG